jgi:hypothetical protein
LPVDKILKSLTVDLRVKNLRHFKVFFFLSISIGRGGARNLFNIVDSLYGSNKEI